MTFPGRLQKTSQLFKFSTGVILSRMSAEVIQRFANVSITKLRIKEIYYRKKCGVNHKNNIVISIACYNQPLSVLFLEESGGLYTGCIVKEAWVPDLISTDLNNSISLSFWSEWPKWEDISTILSLVFKSRYTHKRVCQLFSAV